MFFTLFNPCLGFFSRFSRPKALDSSLYCTPFWPISHNPSLRQRAVFSLCPFPLLLGIVPAGEFFFFPPSGSHFSVGSSLSELGSGVVGSPRMPGGVKSFALLPFYHYESPVWSLASRCPSPSWSTATPTSCFFFWLFPPTRFWSL